MIHDLETWRRVSELFDAYMALDADDQAARLARLAVDEPDVASELVQWLQKDQQSQGALDHLSCRFSQDNRPPEAEVVDRAGQHVGCYRLVRRVGRGGMGEVYEAVRLDADFAHVVAVKVLRRGLDSEDIVRRFVRERRILAQLEHPGIARLIDGGLTADSLPFLVMEFVDGRSLLEAVDAFSLDINARLALFLQICDAVAYAHRRLIVHRDLKPANILLTNEQQIKLLDFGIAKLLDGEDDDAQTQTGMRVLTPDYAAPEQLLGQTISTATDVYALGVILFELLTGQAPYPRHASDLQDGARSRLDAVVTRPSVLLQQSRQQDSGARGLRANWARQVAGDLDTICMHALKVEPERRYQGAAELADDIRRHLQGHPLRAHADTLNYRLRKFVRRHRGGVTAALLASIGVMLGLILALWQAGVANRQAQRADLEAQRARTETYRAEAVTDFVLALFREQNPLTREQTRATTAGVLLQRGIDQAKQTFADDPGTHAIISGELAALQFSLGDVQTSARHLGESLALHAQVNGVDSTAYARVQATLGGAQLALGEFDEAQQSLDAALRTLRNNTGNDSIETAEAETHLVRMLLMQGRVQAALALARHSYSVHLKVLGPSHVSTLKQHYNTGVALEQLGRLAEAEDVFREVLIGYERAGKDNHAALIYPRTMLARVLSFRHNYQEAGEVMATALSAAQEVLEADHPMIGQIVMQQGDIARQLGHYDAAEQAWQTAEHIFAKQDAPELGMLAVHRGALAMERAQPVEAIQHYERAIALYARLIGEDAVSTFSARLRLAGARVAADQVPLALRSGAAAYAAMLKVVEQGSFDESHAHEAWAEVLLEAQGHAESEDKFRKALQIQRALGGPDTMDVAIIESGLATAIFAQRPSAPEVLALIAHAIDVMQEDNIRDTSLAEALMLRGRSLQQSGQRVEAKRDWEQARALFLESPVVSTEQIAVLDGLLQP